jgi:chemotaxis response regulator CheB
LIADVHDVVRTGLLKLLNAHPGWKVVAVADDGREALAKAIQTKPDRAPPPAGVISIDAKYARWTCPTPSRP